jgi:hypothetical protein
MQDLSSAEILSRRPACSGSLFVPFIAYNAQLFLQRLSRALDVCAYCRLPDAEHLGNLFIFEAFYPAQPKAGALH